MKTVNDTTFRIMTIQESEFKKTFSEMDSRYWNMVQSTFDMDRHEFTIEFVREGGFIDNVIRDIVDMLMGE